jgi:hypothetical protein
VRWAPYGTNVVAAAASTVVVALHGLVMVSPATCPTAAPCAKPAAHVLLSFTRTKAIPGAALKMVWTDARGRYSTQIAPGTWLVQATGAIDTKPGAVLIRAGQPRTLNFRLKLP